MTRERLNRRRFLKAAGLGAAALALPGCSAFAQRRPTGAAGPAQRPNVVLILIDDMGWTDAACYGSRYYETPNLDALAADGIRFTQFYNTARCCPTRASLLTGLYPHQAGIGHMMRNSGLPGSSCLHQTSNATLPSPPKWARFGAATL